MAIRLLDYESTTAAWLNCADLREAIAGGHSGLRPNDLPNSAIDTWIGRVAGVEALELGSWASRNNALAQLCLSQGSIAKTVEELKVLHGRTKVGVVLGSSTSSIDRTEEAYCNLDANGQLTKTYQQPRVHNPNALSLFVADLLGLTGPAMTINTACSSSAKVFATAARWLSSGLVDAILVGGTDCLCLSVVHGFHSLQLVSSSPCKPFDQHRDGINIGEASGFAILVRADHPLTGPDIALTGYGESSDAHHMSHPHPEGDGARRAICDALERAALKPEEVGYINLHGTASLANDAIEGRVIQSIFPSATVCSSTKGWTGHTLGAAGITEAIIAMEALQSGMVPANLNLQQQDPELALNLPRQNEIHKLQHVMSNSFGFGGNNCSLIFSQFSQLEGRHASGS